MSRMDAPIILRIYERINQDAVKSGGFANKNHRFLLVKNDNYIRKISI